jgi:hypothetical protein
MADQAVEQQKYDDENAETVTAEEAVLAMLPAQMQARLRDHKATIRRLLENVKELHAQTLPPGQNREEDLTPAELRELKETTAEAIRTAYALKPAAVKPAAVKPAADMLFETLEPRKKLVVCLRAEVAALHEAMHAAYVAEADAVVQARAADLACAEAQAAQVESDYG